MNILAGAESLQINKSLRRPPHADHACWNSAEREDDAQRMYTLFRVESGDDFAVNSSVNSKVELQPTALQLHADLVVESAVRQTLRRSSSFEEVSRYVGEIDEHAAKYLGC